MFIPTTTLTQGGGGLLTELYDETLGGDAASIDTGAGGFSTSLDVLYVFAYVRTTEAVTISGAQFNFNNDTGANYDYSRMRLTNTTFLGVTTVADTGVVTSAPGANAQAGAFGAVHLWMPAYSQTTGHKSFTFEGSSVEDTAADCRIERGSARWRSTDAVNRIRLIAASGNLLAGTRMTVYGVG